LLSTVFQRLWEKSTQAAVPLSHNVSLACPPSGDRPTRAPIKQTQWGVCCQKREDRRHSTAPTVRGRQPPYARLATPCLSIREAHALLIHHSHSREGADPIQYCRIGMIHIVRAEFTQFGFFISLQCHSTCPPHLLAKFVLFSHFST
jgi:hypothetical protein